MEYIIARLKYKTRLDILIILFWKKFKEFDKCFIKKGDMQYSNKMLNISIFKANNGIFVF